ncbi:MAG: adenylosuccinate lyase [Candidatus Diapherotrites archaeon]|nr:adenylosuccinate lyase [Candidatus Diapherotrites archaeon]
MTKKIALFDLVNPVDFRYYGGDESLVQKLSPYLSENARIASHAKVEACLAKALAKNGVCSRKIAEEIAKACEKVSAEEVYEEEKSTKHDVRALANVIKRKVSIEAKPFVHFCATSYDIVDTASAYRYKKAVEEILLPELVELEKTFIGIALREKASLQIGRTHGQHAEPITFGFAMSSYVSRLGNRTKYIFRAKDKLCGKFSGAVGAYNASSLLIKDPLKFENDVMEELGLRISISSTQIAEPEPLADLSHSLISTFSVLANFSDDMRHLQRTEIAEVGEAFDSKQVGSSTMPHKRNPINFENVKSLWKAFMPRSITAYLDEISEHQRDLTNSASQRFLPELILALYLAANRLNRTCKKLVVDRQNMLANFNKSRQSIIAEPMYLLLAFYGHSDAHEKVKQLTLQAGKAQKPLAEIAFADKELKPFFAKFSKQQLALLGKPEHYTGLAEKKTEIVCREWEKKLKELKLL